MHAKHWHLFLKSKPASNLFSWLGMVQGMVWINPVALIQLRSNAAIALFPKKLEASSMANG